MGKAAFRAADVKRMLKGAIDAGWAPGSHALQLVDGKPTLIPLDQAKAATEAENIEARMRAAFGK